MRLLSRVGEAAAQELFAIDTKALTVGVRQRLSLLSASDLVDSDLGVGLSALTVGEVASRRRKRYKVDFVSVLRSRNHLLRHLVRVVDDDVVTCHIDQLLLLVDVEALVQSAVHTEDEPGINSYSLHAHVSLHHLCNALLSLNLNYNLPPLYPYLSRGFGVLGFWDISTIFEKC